MKRLVSLAKWIGFVLILLPIFTKRMTAQGHEPPIIVAVGDRTDVTRPDLYRIAQPFIYESWWKEIARCQNVVLPEELARRIKFVVVNSESFILGREWGVMGYASWWTATIYLASGQVFNKQTVQHEMMHLLLTWNGIDQGRNWHPPEYFDRVCGLTIWYEDP
jgi:hypothetical protein